MPDDPDRDALNETFGGAYQIVRELGRGAFATVYLARERVLHRLVAIKVLHLERAASEAERDRFMREARTAAHLDHPGVVPVLAFGETPTTMYMVMRYIDGESLADRMQREKRLPPDEVRRLLLDLSSALAHAHRQAVLYVRSRGAPEPALRAVREQLAKLNPNIALERPQVLADAVGGYMTPQRIGAFLIGVFGLVGLTLAAAGLYGVLAFGVAQRLREFGVRMALGAQAPDVVRLVVRDGILLVAVGVVIGLGVAVFAGRLVASFLFGLNPADPLTLVAVPLILVAVGLLASAVPARRAAAADPMASLRAE